MSLARTTLGLSRAIEGIAARSAGRRGIFIIVLGISSVLVLSAGMFLILGGPKMPVLIAAGSLAAIATFVLMLVRHEWLLLFGLIAGHTLFYGKFPYQLGMRVKNSVGPGDILMFLSFIAAIIYWYAQKDRPRVPRALYIAPMLLFVYTAGYMALAFFERGIQDIAMKQVLGWFYFTVALPTFLCLSTGRIWSSFFTILFVAAIAGGVLSFCVETGNLMSTINLFGFGGTVPRSFGDLTARTNELGLAVLVSLIAIVITAFAKNPWWKYASILGGLGAAMILFLDRGRATYAGMLVAVILLLIGIPMAGRLRFFVRSLTAVTIGVLIVMLIGGKVSQKFTDTVTKAQTSISLASAKAIQADPGIEFRNSRLRQAGAIFRSNPFFGGGPGTYFKTEFDWLAAENQQIAFIDNSWMYPLSVGGIVGMGLILASYASFVGLTIWALGRLKHPFHRALAFVPLAQMAWLLINSPVTFWMVDQFHIAAFSFGVGMVMALVYHERTKGSEVPIIPIEA